jgi:diaminopimelate epimerase
MTDKIDRESAPLSTDVGVEQTLLPALVGLWMDPRFLFNAQARLQWCYAMLYLQTMLRATGLKLSPLAVPEDGDNRFASAEWEKNPFFAYQKQLYLLNAEHTREMIHRASERLSPPDRLALRIFADQILKSMSPSRFAMTSPEGWQETAKSGGFNLMRRFNKLLFNVDRASGAFRLRVSDAADYYPGGNDTYVCIAEGETRSSYHDIDALIKALRPHFEQGGFLERCEAPAVVKLHMAGGEFCGNAARCVAAWVANEYRTTRKHQDLVRYDCIEETGDELAFSIEVSGASRPLSARCVSQGEDLWVEVEMPTSSRLNHTHHEVEFNGKILSIDKVEMEGIVHLLIDRTQLPWQAAPSIQRKLLEHLDAQLDLSLEPAVGLIWHDSATGKPDISIDPVVYVRATDSLIYESACGSGSLAAAVAFGRGTTTHVKQPSQSEIVCRLVQDEKGTLRAAFISGIVELRGTFDAPAA